jgi:hypothetical protein
MLINPGADGAGDDLEQVSSKDEWMYGADNDKNFVLDDDTLEDASGIEWSRDQNWDLQQHYYDGSHTPANIEFTYASILTSGSTFRRNTVLRSQLNEKQRKVMI